MSTAVVNANKEAALAWLDALARGDIAAYRASLAEDVRHEVMGSCAFSGVRNRDESCALVSRFIDSFVGGVRFEVDHVTAEEDRVAIAFRGFAQLVGGAHYNNSYHVLFRIRDGKISEIHEYADTKLVDEVLISLQAQL